MRRRFMKTNSIAAVAVLCCLGLMQTPAHGQTTGPRSFSFIYEQTSPAKIYIDNKPYVQVDLSGYHFLRDPHVNGTSSRFRVTLLRDRGFGFTETIASQVFQAQPYGQNGSFKVTRTAPGSYYVKFESLSGQPYGTTSGQFTVSGVQ